MMKQAAAETEEAPIGRQKTSHTYLRQIGVAPFNGIRFAIAQRHNGRFQIVIFTG
jgi:hypothetical protein